MNKDLKEKFGFTLAEGATHVGIFHNTRRVGFTLAEVLITLGIIGIVSAMTIPTLVKNYQEKILVNKAKQADAQIKNAVKMYMAKNNCYDRFTCLFDTNKTSHQVVQELATVFKSAEVCPDISNSQQKKKCKEYSYKGNEPIVRNGKYSNGGAMNSHRLVLKNGMFISVSQQNSCERIVESKVYDEFGYETGEIITYTTYICAYLYVDTNGNDTPNQEGRDIFQYRVYDDKGLDDKNEYITNIINTNKLIYTDYPMGAVVPGQE